MKDCSNDALISGNQCQNLKVLLLFVILSGFLHSFNRIGVFIVVTFLVIFSFEFLFPNVHFFNHSIKINILSFIIIILIILFHFYFFSCWWFLRIHCISDYALILRVWWICLSNFSSLTVLIWNLKHINDHFWFVGGRSIEHRMGAQSSRKCFQICWIQCWKHLKGIEKECSSFDLQALVF